MSKITKAIDGLLTMENMRKGQRDAIYEACSLIEEMNIQMEIAAGSLSCLRDLDFHGKWRIQRALHALSIRDTHRADMFITARMVVKSKRKKKK